MIFFKKFIIVIVVFICTQNFYGQSAISTTVVTLQGKALKGATVIAYDKNNQIIEHTITDKLGKFNFTNTKNINSLKISYIGFESKIINKEHFNQKVIRLKEKEEKLKEVIISANIPDVIIKKDTTIYNLKKLLNNTETTLEDVIKKLPGLQIDNNGKITKDGNEIDKVLVEGKDFFGKQHKIATQNITSDMIKGIEVFDNYKTVFEGKSEDGITVLNIHLKNKYKNKITGNTNINAGIIKKYVAHINLFQFKKKTNFSLIADTNNLGEKAISLNDYLEFRGGVKNFIKAEDITEGVQELDKENIPTIFLKDDNVSNRVSYFGGINFNSDINPDLYLNNFYIFNKMYQNEKNITLRKNYTSNNVLIFSNDITTDIKLLNGATELKYKNKQLKTKILIVPNLVFLDTKNHIINV